MLRWAARLTAVCAVLLMLQPATGVADPLACPPGTHADDSGQICVRVDAPGQPGIDPQPGGEPSEPVGCFHGNDPVPCQTEQGVWFPGHQCYAQPYDGPPSDPGWAGHTGGSLWSCAWCQGTLTGTCRVQIIWLPTGASPVAADPGVLAQSALGTLQLATADLQTAPRPPAPSIVGVENWLWVPRAQWQTLRKSVGVGGTTVTVSAAPARVRWDMGPTEVTCNGPGRVWRPWMGDSARTPCGYTYRVTSRAQPRGLFTLSARIVYRVDWTCAGACSSTTGSLGEVDAPAGAASLEVLQRQVVNQ